MIAVVSAPSLWLDTFQSTQITMVRFFFPSHPHYIFFVPTRAMGLFIRDEKAFVGSKRNVDNALSNFLDLGWQCHIHGFGRD